MLSLNRDPHVNRGRGRAWVASKDKVKDEVSTERHRFPGSAQVLAGVG